ncbi:DNA primase small subunit [Euwallacea similis]|uniref:DNA primase small subunit n=1 Tax=Euwallacea similis TaxID=1736056 RepID=UPI00344D9EC6
MTSINEDQLPDLLPLYYKRVFPSVEFYRWLSYGKAECFSRREISFTLFGDIYLRYQSFDTYQDFLNELIKKYPIKIDVGAIYDFKPKDQNRFTTLKPKLKEIVFDIDMTDYDNIRICCSGANVCNKCWRFLVIAAKSIDCTLREDFGFEHVLWVFSGRRGIHAWVCDQTAKECDDNERSAIAEYFNIFDNSMSNGKTVKLPGNISTKIQRDLEIINKYFRSIIEEQDLLGTAERLDKFMNFIEGDIKAPIKERMSSVEGSWARWEIFNNTFLNMCQKNEVPRYGKNLVEELKLQICYPRLDIHVTKGTNHLLKAPFCIHPKTGKVCIPFSIRQVDSFDPNKVPTIDLIIKEVDTYDKKTKEQGDLQDVEEELPSKRPKIKDYRKTSLLKPVNLFMMFIKNLEKDCNIESLR